MELYLGCLGRDPPCSSKQHRGSPRERRMMAPGSGCQRHHAGGRRARPLLPLNPSFGRLSLGTHRKLQSRTEWQEHDFVSLRTSFCVISSFGFLTQRRRAAKPQKSGDRMNENEIRVNASPFLCLFASWRPSRLCVKILPFALRVRIGRWIHDVSLRGRLVVWAARSACFRSTAWRC